MVGLIEVKSSVARERQRVEESPRYPVNTRAPPRETLRPPPSRAGVGSMACWGCGQIGQSKRNCPRRNTPLGNGRAPGGQQAPEAGTLSTLNGVGKGPRELPLWVDLHLQIGKVPALVDTGAQFSCIRVDLAEFIRSMGKPCRFESCSLTCSLADGRECRVTEAVKLHVKLHSFAWDHEFKVLKGGSSPVILGLDFLESTKMVVDVASRKFAFTFAPDVVGSFGVFQKGEDENSYLRELRREAVRLSALPENPSWEGGSGSVLAEFLALFSRTLGTATCPLVTSKCRTPFR